MQIQDASLEADKASSNLKGVQTFKTYVNVYGNHKSEWFDIEGNKHVKDV